MRDFIAKNDYWVVIGEWIGEGLSGDYDDTDPEDYPHMRYDFYTRKNDPETHGYGRVEAEDSYCTMINAEDRDAVIGMGFIFLNALDSEQFPKRQIQELTWTSNNEAVAYFRTLEISQHYS